MRHAGDNLLRAFRPQQRRRSRQRARRLRQIIHYQHRLPSDLPDHRHRFHFGSTLPLLGDNRQPCAEKLGIGVRHLQTAHIRTHHHQILQTLRLQVFEHHRRCIKMIDRNIKKTLNLLRVQIHRQNTIRPSGHQKIRHQLCRDRNSRLILSILASIPIKRQHGRDPQRTRSTKRIHHDEHFHQMMIRRWTRGLDNKNILPAHILINFDKCLTVRKRADSTLPQLHADRLRDRISQRLI